MWTRATNRKYQIKKNVACILFVLVRTYTHKRFKRIYTFSKKKRNISKYIRIRVVVYYSFLLLFTYEHCGYLCMIYTHYRWQCIVVYICWKYEFFCCCCCSLFYFVTLYTVCWLRSLSSAWRYTLFLWLRFACLLIHLGPSANTQPKCTIVIIRILRSICRCSGGRNRAFPCVRAILLLISRCIWVYIVWRMCEYTFAYIFTSFNWCCQMLGCVRQSARNYDILDERNCR